MGESNRRAIKFLEKELKTCGPLSVLGKEWDQRTSEGGKQTSPSQSHVLQGQGQRGQEARK